VYLAELQARFEDGEPGGSGRRREGWEGAFLLHIVRQVVTPSPGTGDQGLLRLMRLPLLCISQVKAFILRAVHIML